ncbi:MAG: beta-ketoacyl synthase [candidate division Zixibacteria bacterium]|nr:beta-ketoacyl synthase [candidate division Zixibacteria bacterium]
MKRVGIFGWGIVAPRSPNIERFAANLARSESWLAPFDGFGPNNFLVGTPDFRFEDYRSWIDARFPPNRFTQLTEKMDPTALHAIGAFIQALGQNPGMETELQTLGTAAHVYIGTGVGNLPTISRCTLDLYRAQRVWNRFWGDKQRNEALRSYLAASGEDRLAWTDAPVAPSSVPDALRDETEEAWYAYWTGHSSELAQYLATLAQIEGMSLEGDVETGKIRLMKEKQRRKTRLQEEWGAPIPPWESVSPNLIWNIHNTPASQVTMMGRIHGLSLAPVAACSTFGVCLKLALDAIRRGEAKAVVVGATDPPPTALLVGAFYRARVSSADAATSRPLTGLRGTHVSGGSVLWIVGDYEYMTAKGFRPLGMEPVAVGVSSDAEHIITPSREGPLLAMRQALEVSGVKPEDIASWDLHATATPGDFLEMENLLEVVPGTVTVTARKGTFGHGMSAGGGWELTAQYLGYERGILYPTPLTPGDLNPEIARLHDRFVFDDACKAAGIAGKLSMGIGGINACVISRPLSHNSV